MSIACIAPSSLSKAFLHLLIAIVVTLSGSSVVAHTWPFLPYREYPIPGHPNVVATAIGDVNGDGRNEIVFNTRDYLKNVSHLAIAPQNPSEQSNPWTLYPAPENMDFYSVSTGDVNNDGRTDVVVGGGKWDYEGSGMKEALIGVFLQNEAGALGPMLVYSLAKPDAVYIQIADMNDDGLLDVVGMGFWGDSISVRYQDTDGTLATEVVYEIPEGQYSYFVPGDINNDGLMDLVVLTPKGIAVFLRRHDNSFGPPELQTLSDMGVRSVAIGDVNGDGLSDVVVSVGGNQPSSYIAILHQTPAGTLAPAERHACYDIPGAIKIADVNLDGRNDIIVVHVGWYSFGVLIQSPDGAMLPEELYLFARSQNWHPQALAVGDLNGDGFPDLIYGDNADNWGAMVALNSGGYRTINVTLGGSGTGGVIDSIGAIACSYPSGNYCASGIWKGLPINFYAKPDEGSLFTGWAGACSGTGTCALTTDEDITLTAFFERQAALNLQSWWGGWEHGVVTSSPPGIECGAQGLFCKHTFEKGTTVTLTPHPAPGATFMGWSETWLCPGPDECTLTMDGDKELGYSFSYCTYSLFPPQVSFPADGGTTTAYVISMPSGYASCTQSYPVGNCAWLDFRIIGATGSNGTATSLEAEDNRSGLPRTCTGFAAGQTMVVTQDGATCSVSSIKPSSQTLPTEVASGTFLVKATLSDCPWTASTQAPWIHIATAQGSGEAPIVFTLDDNPDKTARTGIISVKSLSNPAVVKKFTVRQKPGNKTGAVEAVAHGDTGNSIEGPFYEDLFRPYILFDPGSDILAVAVGDMNNDGWKDIVALTEEALLVYLQDMQGDLQDPAKYTPGPGAMEDIDIADVNGDGRNDVVVASCGLQVYLQNSSGTLDPFIVYPSPDLSGYCFADVIRTGDFNNDGRTDVAGIGFQNQLVASGVWYQNASGTLDPPLLYYTPYWGKGQMDAADVTGDGRTDLIVMSGQCHTGASVYVLPQTPEGTLDAAFQYDLPAFKFSRGMAAGDVNGDGRKDVVQTTYDGFIGVFLQGQDGKLREPILYPSLARGIPDSLSVDLGSVATGDLDGDGRDDIAFLYSSSRPYLGVLLQDKNGRFKEEQRYRVPEASYDGGPKALIIADVNGDGFNDLVVGERQWGVVILYNMGTTRFVAVTKNGEGEGSVASDPAGIDCGSACTKGYAIGTTVTLTASPAADSIFAGWSGACSGTGSCVLTITKDTEVTATFTKSCLYSVSPSLLTPAYGGETMEVKIQGTGSASCPAPAISELYDWIEGSVLEWEGNAGMAKIVIKENTSSIQRSASVSASGSWIAVRQSGVPCRIERVYGGPAKIGPEGGKRGLQVMTTTHDCPWSLSASDPWIHLESSYGHQDGASVAYSVDPNTTGKSRRGSITATSLSSSQTKKNLVIHQK